MAGIRVKLNEQNVKLNFQINEESLNNIKSRMQSFIKELESNSIKLNFDQVNSQVEQLQNKLNNKPMKMNIESNLNDDKSGIGTFINTFAKSDDLVKQVNNSFKDFGETTVTTYKNANKEINSFVVKLQDAEGNMQKLKYMSNKDKEGNILGYDLKGITEVNNQSKILENTLKEEQKTRQAINKENEKLANQIGNKRESTELKNKEELIKLTQRQAEEENKVYKSNIENINKLKTEFVDLKTRYKDVFSQSQKGQNIESNLNKNDLFKDTNELSKLTAKTKELKTELADLRRVEKLGENVKIIPKDAYGDIEKISKSMKELYGDSAKIKNISNGVDSMGNEFQKVKVVVKETENEVKTYGLTVDKTTSSIYKNTEALSSNVSKMNDFGVKVKNAFQSIMAYAGVSGAIYEAVNQFKNAISYVNEADKSFTNFAMVMGTTKDKATEVGAEFSKLAGDLYSTNKEIFSGGEELLRAGMNMSETKKMLESTTIASKLSGQQSKETTQQMISIMNGFKMEAKDMAGVVDTLVGIDNAASTSFAEISQAMQRTASSAKMAGVDFKDLSTYIGTVSSVTRKSADTIGESFKSVFSRFQDVKNAKVVDADGESLSNVERDLNKVGIALRSSKGEFRDFSTVINELSGKWKELNTVQKSLVSKSLAGTRQRENFLVLLDNMDKVGELNKVVGESTGKAKENFDKLYGESNEAKINKMKHAMENFYASMVNSKAIGSTVDGLTKIIGTMEQLTKSSATTKIALAGLGVSAVLLVTKFGAVKTAFGNIGAFMSLFANNTRGLKGAIDILGASFVNLKTSMMAVLANPATWLFVALATAIGVATYAIIKHINEQKRFREQIDKNKKSVEDLAEAMKSMDKAQIKSAVKPLEDEQKKLQDNLKLREDIKKKIEETYKIDDPNVRADALKGYNQQLQQVNKELETQKKELKESNIAFNEQTGVIDKIAESEGKLQTIYSMENIEIKRKKTEEMVQTYNELSQASNLNNEQEQKLAESKNYLIGVLNNEKASVLEAVDRYSELLGMKERTDAENAEMADLLGFLKGKEDDLNVSIVDSTGVLDGNKEQIHQRIGSLTVEGKTLGNLAQAEYRSARDRVQVQVGLTRMTVAEVRKRIQAYQAEARALQQSLDATTNLKSALDKTSGYSGSGYNAFDIKVDLLEGSLKRNKKTYDQLNNALGDLDKLESSGGGGNLPSVGDGGDYMPSGGDDSGNKGKKDSNGTSPKEKHEAAQKEVADVEVKIDRYKKLNDQLKDYDYYLNENSAKKDAVKTDKEKLDLMKQEISLLEKKRLKIDELRKEQQAEEGELAEKLKGFGFEIKWEQGSDGEWLVTLEDYKTKLKEWVDYANSLTGDAKEKAIKQVKEIEEAIKDYTDVTHDKLAQTNNDWNANAKAISDTNKEMEDLVRNKMKDYIEKQKEADYMEQEEKHKKENIELEKSIYAVTKEQFEAYKTSKINGINEEITKLHDKLLVDAENLDTQDALKSKFEELKMIQDEQFDKIKNYQEVYEKTYKERMENIDKEIKILDDKYEAEQKAEEEAENRAKEEEERKNRLKDIADSQKEINELEKQLINLRKEKNIRTLTKDDDGKFQWDWTHNQQEYEKVQEDINNKEDDLKKKHQEMAKWEQDLIKQKEKKKKEEEHKAQRDKLENEKKYLEEVLRIQQQKYEQQKKTLEAKQQAEKDLLDAHYKDIEKLTDKWLNELKQTYGENWAEMSIIVDEKVTTMEKRIKEMIDAINLANQAVAGLGSGNSGMTSDIIKVGGKVLTSEERYLIDNPDVKAMLQSGNAPFKSGRQHWELWGKDEGREWKDASSRPVFNPPKVIDFGGNNIGRGTIPPNLNQKPYSAPTLHQNKGDSININGNINLPSVKNGNDFVSELQGFSQKAKQKFR